MIATRLALGKTVCAGCNVPINAKAMTPDAVQYRWEGRDYDRYCLTNALAQRMSDAGKWLQVALMQVPATDRVAGAELWEAAKAAAGNTPDGTAWGYNRRLVALARELNRMGPTASSGQGRSASHNPAGGATGWPPTRSVRPALSN